MSREVEDMLFDKQALLDVLECRAPPCPTPAGEAAKTHATPAYMYNKEVDMQCLQRAMRVVFECLWGGAKDLDRSYPDANPFHSRWGVVSEDNESWPSALHVDNWSVAQFHARKGAVAMPHIHELAKGTRRG